MKLPEARVPLFKQMFAYASPEETPPFTDDDEDFHGKIKFVHFRITVQNKLSKPDKTAGCFSTGLNCLSIPLRIYPPRELPEL